MQNTFPYWLAGRPESPNHALEVKDKYSGDVVARVALADRSAIDEAIAAAVRAAPLMKALASFERKAVLEHCAKRFRERFDELAQLLCVEAGKPIRDSRGEVTRLIDTFVIAAEESTRIQGEMLTLDISARAKGYRGMSQRVPVGPCSFVSPFNFPLNLVAHKVAPAIAAGCPFVLKPASRTPLGALVIGEILAETKLPPGAFSILPCRREDADIFATDERVKLFSFTGSPAVGWELKAKAGKKKVVLELGGNAAVVVDEGSDLDDVVQRIVFGAYYQSGQSCISVQRILAHRSLAGALTERLQTAVAALRMGDPKLEDTFIGPMIDVSEAARLERWLDEAVKRGARVLVGGKRDGAMFQATLVADVPKDTELYAKEAFGPIACISTFDDFDQALIEVNESRYGLQAGIFTQNLNRAMKAWNTLEVGAVVIGDVPSFRVDNMPYGGVKDSGLGREGVRYAVEEMTESRLMVLRER